MLYYIIISSKNLSLLIFEYNFFGLSPQVYMIEETNMNENINSLFVISKNEQEFTQCLPKRDLHPDPSRFSQKKLEIINILKDMEEYQKITTLRNQIGFLYRKSQSCSIEKNEKEYKLKQDEIADLLNISRMQVKNHLRKYKLSEEDKIKVNGRPFSLTKQQIYLLSNWLDSWTIPPRVLEVKTFIYQSCNVILQHTSFLKLMEKLGYNIVKVQPMEEKRYTVDREKIIFHFQLLEAFTLANRVPSAFCVNFDEEGHEGFQDAKSEKVVSPKKDKPVYYPIPRNNNRSTFLGCITGDGCFMKPLIITKRKTFTPELLSLGITPDKIMLASNDSGFITTEIFNKWVEQEFVKYINNKRKELGYEGVGIVLCDGFSAHITDYFFQTCDDLNMQVFFLPSHSSHLTQPLDLGIFAAHKQYCKMPTRVDGHDEDSMSSIVRIFTGWEKAATTTNIVSSWKQAGAIFEIGGPSYNRIIFSMANARAVIGDLKINKIPSPADDFLLKSFLKQSENIDPNSVKTKEKEQFKSRIPVGQFNTSSFHEKVKSMKRIQMNEKEGQLFHNLLLALLRVDHCEKLSKGSLELTQKGRCKKADLKKQPQKHPSIHYCNLDFDRKLSLELESLGLIKQ